MKDGIGNELEYEAQMFLNQIREIPVLTEEQQIVLVERIQKGDKEAEHQFVEANLHLVEYIAKNYRHGRNLSDYVELILQGSIGLIKAVKEYDPSRAAFSTFAVYKIKEEILKLTMQRTVHVPKGELQAFIKIEKVIEDYQKNWNRRPSVGEIADELGIEVSKVKQLLEIENVNKMTSLDKKMGDNDDEEDDGNYLSDLIAAPENHGDEIYNYAMNEIAQSVGDTVNDFMRKVVEYSILVEKDDEQAAAGGELKSRMTEKQQKESHLKEIGQKFGITAERVRQILELHDEYQNVLRNIQYVDRAYPENLEAVQESVKSGIGTLHTTEAYQKMSEWSSLGEDSLKTWDSLFDYKDTFELIKHTELPKFCDVFHNYLSERYGEILLDTQVEKFIVEEFVRNGYCEKVNQKKINSIGKTISKDTISVKEFFELAIGLNMSVEDAEEFLKKFFMREGFNLFDPDELIIYLALGYAKEDKKEFIAKAKEEYEEIQGKPSLEMPEKFNTAVYKSQIKEHLEKNPEDFHSLYAYVKYLWEHFEYQRTANKIFADVISDLEKYTKNAAQKAVAILEKTEYATGEVIVHYDCTKGLHIPEGQQFVGHKKEGDIFCVTTEEVNCPVKKEFQAQVRVACIEPFKGECDKQTLFVTEASYIKKGYNKYALKPQEHVEGNITITCEVQEGELEDFVLPKGTIFTANGLHYQTVADFLLTPTVTIPVKALEEISKNHITEIVDAEKYPQIFKIEHSKISGKKAGRAEEDDKKNRMSKQIKGSLERYLYLASGGNTIFGKSIEELDADGEFRRKVIDLLKQTDLNFTYSDSKTKKGNPFEIKVSRKELLTALFLRDMAKEQFAPSMERVKNPKKRLVGRVQEINKHLNESGFYGIYPMNPYERLLLYISTFEHEPMNVYRNLWGMVQDYYKKNQGE